MSSQSVRRLIVRVADHEADDPAWRIRHASETIAIVYAYFETDVSGEPLRSGDGTYAVRAPSLNTLDTLRSMLVDPEGFTIVAEEEVPPTTRTTARSSDTP